MLYGHVFRNAMLIVIAGFPAAFIGVLFTGSLLIEVIFSLDGIGLLGFEAAINRDYPVMFGTLYFFGLIGLVMGIVGDLMYMVVDPRIDFEARGLMTAAQPAPPRGSSAPTGAAWSRSSCSASLFFVSLFAELLANDRPLADLLRRRASTSPMLRDYPETDLRRRLRRPTPSTPTGEVAAS